MVLWTLRMQMWHPAEMFATKSEKGSPVLWRWRQFFSKRLFYPRMFLCKSRNQFWKPRRKKLLPKGSKLSVQLPTLLRKLQSLSNWSFYSKKHLLTDELQFRRPASFFPTKNWRFFAQSPTVLDWKPKKFCSLSEGWDGLFFFQKKSICHRNLFVDN